MFDCLDRFFGRRMFRSLRGFGKVGFAGRMWRWAFGHGFLIGGSLMGSVWVFDICANEL